MNSASVTVVSSVIRVVRPMWRVLMRVLLVMVSVAWQSEMAMLLLVVHVTEMCDGDVVEAIRARGESSPKRAVKRREILDPSHVSKR